jgi:hypothetical protein
MIYIQKTILLGTLSVMYITNDLIKDHSCDLHTNTISLGTLSAIYTHIKHNIIKDPFYDLHTKTLLLGIPSVYYMHTK